MNHTKYIRLIDRYLEEPHSIDKEWVECLRVCRELLKQDSGTGGWINAEIEVPTGEECVLAVVNGRYHNMTFEDAVQIAEYDSSEQEWVVEAYPEARDIRVTHWMPLPEPPTEKGR